MTRVVRFVSRWSVVVLAVLFALAEEWTAVAVLYAAERIGRTPTERKHERAPDRSDK